MLQNDMILNHQQLRFAEQLEKYYERKRNWKPVVKWYWGETGTGKTKTAYEEFLAKAEDPDDIYFSMDTGKWWEGYDAQPYVIIDDMRGDFLKFHQLLKLLDRYPYKVECKGASRQFLATEIIITSCVPPEELYPNLGEQVEQLIRRIDNIKEFKKKTTTTFTNKDRNSQSSFQSNQGFKQIDAWIFAEDPRIVNYKFN